MTKLEPGRISLAGQRSSSFRKALALAEPEVRKPAPPEPPRKCCSCGKDDVTRIVEGEYEPSGAQRVEHSVTIEFRYIKRPEDCTSYMQSKGWKYRKHQAKHTMERFICRPCLADRSLMQREFSSKKASDMKQGMAHDTYYSVLCGE